MNKNILAGMLLFSIGLIFFIFSFSYSLGTLNNIGPGFFPMIFSIILMIIGILTGFTKND